MKYKIICDPNVLNNCFYQILDTKLKPQGGHIEEIKWWKEIVKETFEKAGIKINEFEPG